MRRATLGIIVAALLTVATGTSAAQLTVGSGATLDLGTLPHCALATAVTMPFGVDHDHWCSIGGKGIPTVAEGTVVLHFEEENLVRWAVIEPDWLARFSGNGSSGYTYQDPFPSTTFDQPSRKDIRHHDRGHKHHHGHK